MWHLFILVEIFDIFRNIIYLNLYENTRRHIPEECKRLPEYTTLHPTWCKLLPEYTTLCFRRMWTSARIHDVTSQKNVNFYQNTPNQIPEERKLLPEYTTSHPRRMYTSTRIHDITFQKNVNFYPYTRRYIPEERKLLRECTTLHPRRMHYSQSQSSKSWIKHSSFFRFLFLTDVYFLLWEWMKKYRSICKTYSALAKAEKYC
jgi:hypothetical protein